MFRINYIVGNGYRCSCCRKESNEYTDFETAAEVVRFLSEKEAANRLYEQYGRGRKYLKENEEDISDFEVVEFRSMDIKFNEDLVQQEIKTRTDKVLQAEKEERKKERDEERKRVEEKIARLGNEEFRESEMRRLQERLDKLKEVGDEHKL